MTLAPVISINSITFKVEKTKEKVFMLHKEITILALIWVAFSISYGQEADYLISIESFKEPATALNISPDGQYLLAGFQDGSFSIFHINSLETIHTLEEAHLKSVYALEMDPQMNYLLTAGFNTIKQWTPECDLIKIWPSHPTTVWNLDISSDGKFALSAEFNKTFRLWNAKTGELVELMKGHDDVTMAVAFSPDNKLIASGSSDLTIKIWDVETRQPVKTFFGPTKEVYDIKFHPEGKIIAAASNDNSVRLYDIEKEKMMHLLKGHRDFVIDVEFSPNGRYLISASADQSIFLWDVETGERIYAYLENQDALLDMVFHPDGNSFFSSSMDKKLKRWTLDPEIFVLKYFEKPYKDEITGNHLFDERRKGESRKDYESRMTISEREREKIIEGFYQQYLERFE